MGRKEELTDLVLQALKGRRVGWALRRHEHRYRLPESHKDGHVRALTTYVAEELEEEKHHRRRDQERLAQPSRWFQYMMARMGQEATYDEHTYKK